MLPADFLPAYLLPLMHLLLEVARLCLGVLAVVTTVVCFIALHYHVTRRQPTWLMGGLGLSFGGLALVTPWLVLWVSAPAKRKPSLPSTALTTLALRTGLALRPASGKTQTQKPRPV